MAKEPPEPIYYILQKAPEEATFAVVRDEEDESYILIWNGGTTYKRSKRKIMLGIQMREIDLAKELTGTDRDFQF